jgi:hypothetical protein
MASKLFAELDKTIDYSINNSQSALAESILVKNNPGTQSVPTLLESISINSLGKAHSQNQHRNRLLTILILICVLITLSISFASQYTIANSANGINSSASPISLKTKFSIYGNVIARSKMNYSSQGSGEIVGDFLYTTGHNFNVVQTQFLLDNGAQFLSITANCSKIVAGVSVPYIEGMLKIPTSILSSSEAYNLGINYPNILRSVNDPVVADWNIRYINPEIVYTRGFIKNRGENFLSGLDLFNANGAGLSGSGYKFNESYDVDDSGNSINYLVGIHIGTANMGNTKINIIWIANGDGTFSYARYLPSGVIIRADELLQSECEL